MGKLHDLAANSAPTFKCLVPSKNKVFTMRYFLVKEQKLLLMAKESTGDELGAIVDSVTQLIQNCMLDELDISTLPSFDIEYMFIQLFTKSTGQPVTKAHYICKANVKDAEGNDVIGEDNQPVLCNDVNAISVRLNNAKVPVDDIKSGVIAVGSPTVDKIVLKYPSFAQMTVHDNGVQNENMDEVFGVYAECLETIYKADGTQLVLGEDYEKEDALEFLDYMSNEVFEQVSSFFNDRPTLTSTEPFVCKKCGNHTEIKLKGLEDFF